MKQEVELDRQYDEVLKEEERKLKERVDSLISREDGILPTPIAKCEEPEVKEESKTLEEAADEEDKSDTDTPSTLSDEENHDKDT
jgi:hypothetical protein